MMTNLEIAVATFLAEKYAQIKADNRRITNAICRNDGPIISFEFTTELKDKTDTSVEDEKVYTFSLDTSHYLLSGITGGWISVKAEMPPKFTDVLVATINGRQRIAYYIPAYDGKEAKWGVQRSGETIELYGIAYWQPLPEPPQGD